MSFHLARPSLLSPTSFQNYFHKIKPKSLTPSSKNMKFFLKKISFSKNSDPRSISPNKSKSKSLVEYETEDSFSKKNINGRELSILICENKTLKDYIETIEKRLKKFENEEKLIRNKNELTRKIQDNIERKREKSFEILKEKENRKNEEFIKKTQLIQKNKLEKKLNKENISKNSNRLIQKKQANALIIKREKETFIEKINYNNDLAYSEKIIKVVDVINQEKNLKNQKLSNISLKKDSIQSQLKQKIQSEKKNYYNLKSKINEMKEKENEAYQKLESARKEHMNNYMKVRSIFSEKPIIHKKDRRYTMASTATFDEKTEIRINTSVISMESTDQC